MSLDISNQLGHSQSMAQYRRKLKRTYQITASQPFDPNERALCSSTAVGAAYLARDIWWEYSRKYKVVTMTMSQKEI